MLRDGVEVLFEDPHFLVLNKPSGLVVNKSETHKNADDTLESFLQNRLAQSTKEEEVSLDRAGIVHRLDKETSGLILAAKNQDMLLALQALFKNRQVKKEYVAVCIGQIADLDFKIDAPIGRNPNKRTRYSVIKGGKAAITEFRTEGKLLADNQPYTFVRAFPLTGRTHQIRVHLAAYNHPIAGDQLYSGSASYLRDKPLFGRLMLHAHKISFTHPVTGSPCAYEAPLPEIFSKYLL